MTKKKKCSHQNMLEVLEEMTKNKKRRHQKMMKVLEEMTKNVKRRSVKMKKKSKRARAPEAASGQICEKAAAFEIGEASARPAPDKVLTCPAARRKASYSRVFSDEELLEKFGAEEFDRILKGEITLVISTLMWLGKWFYVSVPEFYIPWLSLPKDRACTTLIFFHPMHVKLGVLVRIVSLLKGSSVRFMLTSLQVPGNQMMIPCPKNPLGDYIMRMIQSLFPITHCQLARFPNDCYLIGGGRDGTRFLLKFLEVQMGTFDTISGEFYWLSLPQRLGLASKI